MPNETIDKLALEIEVKYGKALKEAEKGGTIAGESFAKAWERRVNQYDPSVHMAKLVSDARSKYQTSSGALRSPALKKAVSGNAAYASIAKASADAIKKSAVAEAEAIGKRLEHASSMAKSLSGGPRLNTGSNFFQRAMDSLGGHPGVTAGSGFASNEIEKSVRDTQRLKDALGAVKMLLSPVQKAVANALVKPFHNAVNAIKAVQERVERFRKTIARIVLYRTIRSLMSNIKKAVQEGLENLYQYSTVLGTTFAQSMDTIASSALFIKNSFAAMVAPIVDKIAPAIYKIADYIGNAANEMAEFFTIVTKGTNQQYSRAIWFMKKYKDEAKGAKKMLDLLGIDEINRLSDASGSGNSDDFDKMFEEAISGEGNSFATALGNSIENDDWDSVGKILAKKLNDVLAYVKESDISSKIGGTINKAITAVHSFLDEVSFSGIATTITGFLKNLDINWSAVGETWIAWKTNIFDLILGLFEDSEWWGKVGKGTGEFFKGVLNGLAKWVDDVDWEQIGRNIWTSIDTMIQNIDWIGLGKSLGNAFIKILEAAANLLKGLFDAFCESVFSIKKGGWVDRTLTSLGIEHGTNGEGWRRAVEDAKRNQDSITGGGFASTRANQYAAYGSAKELALLAELDKYATGGYVPQGDLFIANEAGPELVGTMNGRTYVGSNSDINSVGTGIENAVYAMANMVVQAIERKDTNVSLDGDKLSKAVSNRQNLAALARG